MGLIPLGLYQFFQINGMTFERNDDDDNDDDDDGLVFYIPFNII